MFSMGLREPIKAMEFSRPGSEKKFEKMIEVMGLRCARTLEGSELHLGFAAVTLSQAASQHTEDNEIKAPAAHQNQLL